MKNHLNSITSSLSALSAFGLLLVAGCTTALSPTNGEQRILLASEIGPPEILSRYDTSNIVGIIQPRMETYHIQTHVFPASGRSTWTGTQRWGQAQFADGNGVALDIGDVMFNKQFVNISSTDGSPTGSYTYTGDDLPIYTDGTTPNYVMVRPFISANGSTFDTLTFSVVPHITNISYNQNLSRDSTITINWTGTSGDFVLASVTTWDSTGMNDRTGKNISVGGYYDNTGSVTIPVNNQLVLGLADVEIRVYTPKFITLSNGKRVAVVVETGDALTVHIVN